MYPDGNLQPHEVTGCDEVLCLCGTWTPVSEARTREHYYGTFVYTRCKKCYDIRLRRYRDKRRRRKEREFMRALKNSNLASPYVATNFVEKFRHRMGGVDKLVEKLVGIIEGDNPVAAIQAIELYVSMSRISRQDEQAEFLLQQQEKRSPHKQRHELYNCPF